MAQSRDLILELTGGVEAAASMLSVAILQPVELHVLCWTVFYTIRLL